MTATGHAETCQAHAWGLQKLITGEGWHLSWTRSGVFDPPAKKGDAK